MYTFWLFLFLEFSVNIARVPLFLMAGGHSYRGLEVELPDATADRRIGAEPGWIHIWIDSHGWIVVNDWSVSEDHLDDMAQFLYSSWITHPYFKPVILADKNVPMAKILYILDVLRIAGYERVYFRTYSPAILTSNW